MTTPISDNLRTLRRSHRMTLEAVAERLDVSRQAVAKWESGETAPDLANSAALAELFGVSLDNLIRHDADRVGADIPPKGKHLFGTVTVGERGQIVIPKKARELFGIRPGDRLLVLGEEDMGARGLALVDPELFFAHLEQLKKAMGGGAP